jgi:hypothetical protein
MNHQNFHVGGEEYIGVHCRFRTFMSRVPIILICNESFPCRIGNREVRQKKLASSSRIARLIYEYSVVCEERRPINFVDIINQGEKLAKAQSN